MAKFRYKLQTVLDVAEHKERSVRMDLVRAQAAESEARQRLDATLQMGTHWEERVRDLQHGRLDARQLHDMLRGLDSMRQRAAREREALRAAERAVEAVRVRLTEAAQSRKMLERLKERAGDEYNAQALSLQIKATDEIASVRSAAMMSGAHS